MHRAEPEKCRATLTLLPDLLLLGSRVGYAGRTFPATKYCRSKFALLWSVLLIICLGFVRSDFTHLFIKISILLNNI